MGIDSRCGTTPEASDPASRSKQEESQQKTHGSSRGTQGHQTFAAMVPKAAATVSACEFFRFCHEEIEAQGSMPTFVVFVLVLGFDVVM